MIDFHCHIDLYENPKAVVDEIAISDAYVLSVTTTPKAFLGTEKLAEHCPRIQTALGFHPQVIHLRYDELPLFELLLPQAKYVGEIGLDGSREYRKHFDLQRSAFRQILNWCAKSGGRVMSIHSRSAASDVLDELERAPKYGVPVLHWFSGTQIELRRAVSLGAWFSVGPAMFKTERGRARILKMPRDRLLTETDGPFASYEGKILYPLDVITAEKLLANLWGETVHTVQRQLQSNLRTLCENLPQTSGQLVQA